MALRSSISWKHACWWKTRPISHLSDRFLQNSFNMDTLNLSRLHRYITYLVCTRWLGRVRFRGNTRVGVKTGSISHLSDRFLQNSFNVDTLNLSRLHRYITYLACTRWLGGVRFRGNTCVGVKGDLYPTYPTGFFKIASTWTPSASHDCNGIVLTLCALDGSEKFDFVETHVLV